MCQDGKNVKRKMREIPLGLCPWCFSKGNDCSGLFYDKTKKRYYCVKCCFTGDQNFIHDVYQDYQKKYKLITKRLHLFD